MSDLVLFGLLLWKIFLLWSIFGKISDAIHDKYSILMFHSQGLITVNRNVNAANRLIRYNLIVKESRGKLKWCCQKALKLRFTQVHRMVI
jgi:hypothetical protein